MAITTEDYSAFENLLGGIQTAYSAGDLAKMRALVTPDRKSTRLNSSHTEIYTLSLHDALPIYGDHDGRLFGVRELAGRHPDRLQRRRSREDARTRDARSEEHTSELQSHRDLHSFPTRRSSDLWRSRRKTIRRSRTCWAASRPPTAPAISRRCAHS